MTWEYRGYIGVQGGACEYRGIQRSTRVTWEFRGDMGEQGNT